MEGAEKVLVQPLPKEILQGGQGSQKKVQLGKQKGKRSLAKAEFLGEKGFWLSPWHGAEASG